MPVVLQMTYADNTQEIQTIPAEIWRKNNAQVTKVIVTKKPVISFVLDPFQQTADTDLSNNAFPRQPAASRFELFQQQQQAQPNPMQQQPKAVGQPHAKAGAEAGGQRAVSGPVIASGPAERWTPSPSGEGAPGVTLLTNLQTPVRTK